MFKAVALIAFFCALRTSELVAGRQTPLHRPYSDRTLESRLVVEKSVLDDPKWIKKTRRSSWSWGDTVLDAHAH